MLAQVVVGCVAGSPAWGLEVDLEDLRSGLGPEGYYEGADGAGGFVSGGAFFANGFTDFGGGFTAWDGFAYSVLADRETPGFENQFSAFPGGGAPAGGVGAGVPGEVFALGFAGSGEPVIRLPEGAGRPLAVSLANTTYAALAMRDGDAFAKRFGGVDGTDPDFFELTVTGRDAGGSATGSASIFLADFRSGDPAEDRIEAAWVRLDLTPLGEGVRELAFSLDSSDRGAFGINTPTYFALDNLVLAEIPEPGVTAAWVGLAAAIAAAAGTARRRARGRCTGRGGAS